MKTKLENNKPENFIPNDAITRSSEVRNQVPAVPQEKSKPDIYSEARMARNIPSDESVCTTNPDETVLPG